MRVASRNLWQVSGSASRSSGSEIWRAGTVPSSEASRWKAAPIEARPPLWMRLGVSRASARAGSSGSTSNSAPRSPSRTTAATGHGPGSPAPGSSSRTVRCRPSAAGAAHAHAARAGMGDRPVLAQLDRDPVLAEQPAAGLAQRPRQRRLAAQRGAAEDDRAAVRLDRRRVQGEVAPQREQRADRRGGDPVLVQLGVLVGGVDDDPALGRLQQEGPGRRHLQQALAARRARRRRTSSSRRR